MTLLPFGGGLAPARPLITLDSRIPAASGIGNYLQSAVQGALAVPGARLRLILAPADMARAQAGDPRVEAVACAQRIYSLREQLAVPWRARGTSLLHVPHYNIPLAYTGALVATIHDVIHLSFPGYASTPAARVYAFWMLRAAVRRPCRVITVSRYSRDEIVSKLGADTAKVQVIYNGLNPAHVATDRARARAEAGARWGLAPPLLLYVGNSKPHKNLAVLGSAFAALAAQRPSLILVLALGGDRAPDWAECHPRVRICPRLPDSDLATLYAAADLLVLPSLCEGFGFPLVEAMAAGTPAICAAAGALPEIGGDAAEFFPPRDPEALANAIGRLLDEPARRRRHQEAGRERARRFSWRRCAQEHTELYAEVLARAGLGRMAAGRPRAD